MDYNEYRKLTNLIDAYLYTGNWETLVTIQNCIETQEGCREKLMNDMIEHNHNTYITVFSADEQVKIISDLVAQIGQKEHLAYIVSWMLPYVSNKVLEQILISADDVALVRIMLEIKGHIRAIGNRFCDSSTYFWLHTTNIFSRMVERIIWLKIYRRCQKNLKK